MGNEREEWQRLPGAFGLCVPVADLKSPSPPLALALHLGEYHPFYLEREEDAMVRKHLQEQSGVLIIGRPLSGKTRMALEAILAVVPDGILLRFSGPERLAKLDALLIPHVLIGGKEEKPSLVVFFDDIDKFEGAPFDELIERLYPQVSKLYVVATCRSGAAPRVLASASLKNLRAGPLLPSRVVEIRPLTAMQAMQVEKEVWKTDPGRDLSLDRTEIGVILLGTKILESSYGRITEDGRRMLRGLFLAERFASPCPKDLLQSIVERVIQNGPFPSFDATLAALIEVDIVQRDDLSRLSIVSHHHWDKVIEAHYSSMSALRQDLKQIESLLEEKGDATHLTALGIYYGERLSDLAAARHVLELSLKLIWHTDTLLSLSLVLARSGEEAAARAVLEDCLKALYEPDRQANLLIRFADELLNKKGSAAAVPFYERAREVAQAHATKVAAAARSGDALLSDNAFERAEPIYREILDKTSDDAENIATARLIVAIVGQRQFERAASDLREQLGSSREMELRHSLAAAVLENGENRFLSDERLAALRKLVWEAIRDTAEGETRTADLLAFASDMLVRGFLSVSKIAYADLRATAGSLNLEPAQCTELLNNLATSHLYLRESAEARPLFEETLSLLRARAETRELFLAAAEDGVAVCDILDGNLQAAKKRYEQMLERGKTAGNDTIKAWAHVGLGEIAWQEGNAPAAHDHFFALRTIPSSFETVVRTDLGLARVCLHDRLFDNADIHISRGLAACVRADYAYLRKEFEKLKQELAAARVPEPPASAAPKGAKEPVLIDALIMKGGGVKGLAFAGAIRELQKDFEFRSFVGTSAGSIAAALLAAGATGADLEEKLRRKRFRDFLDGNLWLAPFTIWKTGGLHPGLAFMEWLRDEISKYVQQALEVELQHLPKRAVIYASSKGAGEITFDRDGQRKDTPVHFAVRCSMSIPFFFQPQRIGTSHVYDGGLLNNYPVEVFLKQERKRSPDTPPPKFIALYLGSIKPSPLRPGSMIGDLVSIVLDRNDAAVIDEYRDHTVIIDTHPVGTIDFDLTEDEKDFLVLQGRAAALKFLTARGLISIANAPSALETIEDAEKLRAEIVGVRKKRRAKKWHVLAMIAGVTMLILGYWILG